MKKPKTYYQEIQTDGFSWSGYWDKLHHFIKREKAGCIHIRCTERDITNGNIYDMIQLGVSK